MFLLLSIESGGAKDLPSIAGILAFLTGCNSVPPLGYEGLTPKITFSDDNVLPRVSTCLLTLSIPKCFPVVQESFDSQMAYCILNS